ncbi:MAG: hypothetical protein A2170_13795 [Deltaproteobacteria bacterium RBG_13_53_10]|nr:MAG: hypothetical protein A2170_13795 [Deltaproteobacteria bacterium RBG_13_53_10]
MIHQTWVQKKRDRVFILGFIFLFLSVTPLSAIGEDYPARPMMIIPGFQPGGTNAITSQIFADHAKKYFSKPQPILINYKPGASQAIAASFVLSQPRDGYT